MFDLELDVDELRCQLIEARAEALGIADEIADAVEQDRPDDARRLVEAYREKRSRIRQIVTALRVEEGNR